METPYSNKSNVSNYSINNQLLIKSKVHLIDEHTEFFFCQSCNWCAVMRDIGNGFCPFDQFYDPNLNIAFTIYQFWQMALSSNTGFHFLRSTQLVQMLNDRRIINLLETRFPKHRICPVCDASPFICETVVTVKRDWSEDKGIQLFNLERLEEWNKRVGNEVGCKQIRLYEAEFYPETDVIK